MSVNKNIALAAFAGLLSTNFMTASMANASEHEGKAVKSEAAKSAKEKHACKGLNSCKGNSPEGKNECKGKSSCATDGSK